MDKHDRELVVLYHHVAPTSTPKRRAAPHRLVAPIDGQMAGITNLDDPAAPEARFASLLACYLIIIVKSKQYAQRSV